MRYVVDIDGTICTPGPTEEMRYNRRCRFKIELIK